VSPISAAIAWVANGVNVNNHMLTYLFGPRVTYRKYRRISPFGEMLFEQRGPVRACSPRRIPTRRLRRVWRRRRLERARPFLDPPLQFDYLLTHLPEVANGNNQTQNNLRVSTGIVSTSNNSSSGNTETRLPGAAEGVHLKWVAPCTI